MPINIDRNRFQNLTHLELLAKQVVEGFITGLHKSPFHGFSVEFAEHRLYNTGESTRDIDWKLYARTEKLFVKRYEEETNLRAQILLDTSGSMFYPEKPGGEDGLNKLGFSVYAAAALIELLRRQRDAVGLSIFSDKVELHTDARSSEAHHKFLFEELEKWLNVDPAEQRQTHVVQALHEIAERIHRRSLVLIFSDMLDNSDHHEALFNELQHLKYNKHEVVLFHVVDRDKELDFKFDNRPYTFVDPETGEMVKAHPNEVREHYLEGMRKFQKEIELHCGQYQIDYVVCDIKRGFHTVLLEYFHKRERMN